MGSGPSPHREQVPEIRNPLRGADRGGKPGLTPECPPAGSLYMRRNLLALYVAGAAVAALVAANGAFAATWIRR